MDLSTISKTFDADFLEVIKFDNLIALIQAKVPNISISFIIESLEKERKNLEKIDHCIPLIFVKKNTIFETINEKKFIPPIGETIYDWSKIFTKGGEKEVMPTYDYQECRFGFTFNLLNYYSTSREVLYAGIDSSNRQGTFETFDSFNMWLDKFHSSLEKDDIYILKRDALSLVSDLVIPDEHILLIKYNRFIDRCNQSEDFFDEKEHDEFEAGACDLAFAIWKKDKNIFEKIIQSGEHFFSKTYLPEEKKDATIEELQVALNDKSIPILLGEYREDDPLKIAIEVRNKYWADYPENVKSNKQIQSYIMRDYGVTKTTATEIEKIACPINRKKN